MTDTEREQLIHLLREGAEIYIPETDMPGFRKATTFEVFYASGSMTGPVPTKTRQHPTQKVAIFINRSPFEKVLE